MQGYALQNNTPVAELAALLDLVVVSIACDIVPMTGENRCLAHFGLQRLNRHPRIGFWALMEQMNRPMPLVISDLVFGMGPLINSVGRLGDAKDAVKLLLASDKNAALERAAHLSKHNMTRRGIDQQMHENAQDRFRQLPDWQQRKSIVLYDPEWHKGIIGIAASRLSEAFYKPAVVFTKSNGIAVASARSIPGFDLYAALSECEYLLSSFGGHAHAAGLKMPIENFDAFATKFEEIARRVITDKMLIPVLDICAKIRFDEIDADFWRNLQKFEPFGPENHNPIFWAEGVRDTGQSRLLDNNHVRFSLLQEGSNVVMRGIGFDMGHKFEEIRRTKFDIAFNLKEERWRDERKVALQVKDLRLPRNE
jgi:single-stranded-DNA-specific exonuclease